MRHEFHPEALAEYEEAARYYARRDPRVAEQFVAAVEDAIERILDSPTR
jgi:plasmid stabilization system protein ParE